MKQLKRPKRPNLKLWTTLWLMSGCHFLATAQTAPGSALLPKTGLLSLPQSDLVIPSVLSITNLNPSVSLGARVTLRANVAGTPPLSYQWLRNGAALAGATQPTLILTNADLSMAGEYALVATNLAGRVTSPDVRLEVDPTFSVVTADIVVKDGHGGPGVVWVDYDNDGFLDLVNARNNGNAARLYHNNGNGTFTRIAPDPFGVARGGCVWGDYDNDGYPDLFFPLDDGRQNLLFHNEGNGTFKKATAAAAGSVVQDTDGMALNAGWADYDRDGWLDLFVSNANWNGPSQKPGYLYHNSHGTFTRMTGNQVGSLAADLNNGFSMTWMDFNADGNPDLFISVVDGPTLVGGPSALYQNNGNGTFTKVQPATLALDLAAAGGQGLWADYNNDGFLDLLLLNWEAKGVNARSLYQNRGDGTFTNLTAAQTGDLLNDPGHFIRAVWGDYDNDGYLDLFETQWGDQPDRLFHNNGDGTFTRITSGSLVNRESTVHNGAGCAWGDYDNDGFLDLVVSYEDAPHNFLYHNSGNTNAWLKLRCIGTVSNRSAFGTKVRVLATIRGKTFWQLREIQNGDAWAGSSSVPHFGLGDATAVQRVRIEWSSGKVTELSDVPARQYITIVEPGDPPALTIALSGGPSAQLALSLHGYPGVPYVLERSADLANWTLLTNVVAREFTGTPIHSESPSADPTRAFYRVRVDSQ